MAFNIIKKKKYQCRGRGGSGLNEELNHLSFKETENPNGRRKKKKKTRALLLEPRQPRSASRCVITGSGGRGEVTLTHWGGAEAAHAELVWGPTGESLRHGAPPHTDRCRSPQSADINQTRAFLLLVLFFPPRPRGARGRRWGREGGRGEAGRARLWHLLPSSPTDVRNLQTLSRQLRRAVIGRRWERRKGVVGVGVGVYAFGRTWGVEGGEGTRQ